jgi:hypothetical protein
VREKGQIFERDKLLDDMSRAVDELKVELERAGGGVLHPASEKEIERAIQFGFPPVLVDFYRESAPGGGGGCVQLKQRIWSVESAISENTDYVPGAELFPLGYVVFASNLCGDSYCIDTLNVAANGQCPVVLFPHDAIEEEASLIDVEKYRLIVATDLEDFLSKFVRGVLVDQPKYA